jgi:hypothetical protein
MHMHRYWNVKRISNVHKGFSIQNLLLCEQYIGNVRLFLKKIQVCLQLL